tara:strand:+ start:13 stop:990 length:978 start_codon:yes stop_codon:yes gene_type:complete
MGWFNAENYVDSPTASPKDLGRYHSRAYIDAVRKVDKAGKSGAKTREIYGLGTIENPVFSGMFERGAMTCGGSIYAAEWVLGGGCAYNPAGGTHHGRPNRASGFCYFNDPVLAILRLLDMGVPRVFYLDLDAHHGDGVEAAFINDPRVATVSIHEKSRWPYSGVESNSSDNIWNFPVPGGFHASELNFLIDEIVLPLAEKFAPDAVVVTCGADGLAGDPLSKMELTNTALWSAVSAIGDIAPRTIVLGGGGYNPWTVIRCWAGLWASLANYDVYDSMTSSALNILHSLDSDLVDEEDINPNWLNSIADETEDLPIRTEIKDLALM